MQLIKRQDGWGQEGAFPLGEHDQHSCFYFSPQKLFHLLPALSVTSIGISYPSMELNQKTG